MSRELLDAELMRRIDRLQVMAGLAGQGLGYGQRRGPRRGAGVELADHRAYAAGDDPRKVDWKAYARLERLLLRLFVEEQNATVHLLVDCSASMAAGLPEKLSFARRLAATLGYAALSGNDRLVIGAFPEAPATAGRTLRGRGATPAMLAALERLEAGERASLAEGISRHAAAARQRGPLLLITDLWDLDWESGLSVALATGFAPTVLHVLAPEELHPQLAGDLRLVDAETGAVVDLSADGELLLRYREQFDARNEAIAGWCRSRRLPYLRLTSDMDLSDIVLDLLRRARVVG